MMYRSGWATKPDQERVLAVRMLRSGFDAVLARAVHSAFVPAVYASRAEWNAALRASDVRAQWDPDHAPSGAKLERRALQLGLRDAAAQSYASEWIVSIEDLTPFVHEQKARIASGEELMTPREETYPVANIETLRALGLARAESSESAESSEEPE